jgi:hypothetical protein
MWGVEIWADADRGTLGDERADVNEAGLDSGRRAYHFPE